MINGSPHVQGNTSISLDEMQEIFQRAGIVVHRVHVGTKPIRGCIACKACRKLNHCVFDDDLVNECATLLQGCNGMIVASPVYYGSANATLIALLDRLFYSAQFDKRMKVGASVVVARRGGCSATFDELNKYYLMNGMPLAPSQYWNSVHGLREGEARQDGEGLQTMRTLAYNMIFMMKSLKMGMGEYGLPKQEIPIATHFIR